MREGINSGWPHPNFSAKNFNGRHKSNHCLAKKAKTVETFRESLKENKQNSRLFEHECYSSTSNPVDLPFCFELTGKGYTLLKHRELLACVVDCNSFETACFLKSTQRQNRCTCSVDKARSFHFVANDHYGVAHAQTSDAVSTLSPLCRNASKHIANILKTYATLKSVTINFLKMKNPPTEM